MIKNGLKHKAAGILAAFLITLGMSGAVWADPIPEETTPTEETVANEPAETTPEETEPVATEAPVIPVETGEPTEYGFGLTPTGNMALQDDISDEEAESIEFLTVTTRDNHTFYLVIEHTKRGDNVHFLNQVDDADLMAVLSDEQVEQYFPTEVGDETSESSGFSILGESDTEPEADKDSEAETEKKGGSSSMTMLLVVVGVVAAVAGGYYFLKIKPKKAGKINEDADFEDDEEYEQDLPEENEDEETEEGIDEESEDEE